MAINWKIFDLLRKQKQDYAMTFAGPSGQEVLHDLAKFCFAAKTTYYQDPHDHALAEGRRQVWLRIQERLNLTSQQLYSLLNGQTIQIPTEDEDNG